MADLKHDKTFRVYHVSGGREQSEYNEKDHFYGMVAVMKYENYGYHMQNGIRMQHRTATAFLQFDEKHKI